jgi:galactokinase
MGAADVIAEYFRRLGMPDEAAGSRAALMARVCDGFEALVGCAPAWSWFVPGRLEVFGKHTDYAGGRSLVAAVPRGFGVAARARDDAVVRVVDVRYGSRTEIDPHDEDRSLTGWASYVQVVARRFARNFPGAPLGVDLAIASDLPRAAGLSSSSALVVAVATALARRAALPARDEWQAEIASIEDLAWYLGCVENGLDYRGLAGTAGVGTHGGSEDHTAILASRAGCLSQYRFMPVAHQGDVEMPAGWSFVIASSGVHADKAGSVREVYNRVSLGTRALLACWNAVAAEPAPSLAAALAADGAVERLRELVARHPPAGYDGAALVRRLSHFITEDARVPRAARAFAEADAVAIRALARDSQREADEWLGNQVEETRALAAAAVDSGAIAASSFGAGFGGSVWALVPAADAAAFAVAWLREYAGRCRTVSAASLEWFVARPGPPLTEVPLA